MEYTQVRKAVTIYYFEQGFKSLSEACKFANVNYRTMDNMINGRTILKLYSIKELIEKLNEKFTAVEIDGQLIIVRR
jgi:predicted HTH domain antitoxin